MTVDWAKTSPWRRLPTQSATRKNPFFAYSDRLGERSERCTLGSQFISIAKASCQAFAAAASNFYRRQDAHQLFQAGADAESRKFRRTSVQSDLLRAAAI